MANFFEQFGGNQAQGSAPYTGNKYESLVRDEAARQGVDPDLAAAVAAKESSFKPHAESGKGAIGLMQVMPATAKDMGYSPEDLRANPALQAQAGVQYLKQMLDSTGNVPDALTAYHSGLGNLEKYKSGQKQMGPETAGYASDPKFSQWHDENMAPFRQTDQPQPQQGQQDGNFFSQFHQPQQDQGTQPLTAEQAQANAPQPEPEQPTQYLPTGQDVAEAGRGALQAGVNVANIPATIADAAQSAAAWAAQKLGMGDGTYQPVGRIELPQNLQPQTAYGKIGAEVAPFLIPGVGAERAAVAAADAAQAGRAAQVGNTVASLAAESLPGALAQSSGAGQVDQLPENLGLGMAGGAAGRAIIAGAAPVARAIGDQFSPAAAQTAESAVPAAGPMASSVVPEAARVSPSTATDYSAAARSGAEGRIAQVVNDIQPNQQVISAAERLNLKPDEMLEAYTSGNDAFKAVQMGLASQDESVLGAIRRDSINKISNRAAKIIDDAGAAEDKLVLNNKFRANFTSARDELMKQESALFRPISEAIPASSKVEAANTKSYLESLADNYGGAEYLSPMEKKAFDAVSPISDKSGAPTYARLNSIRQQVGAALNRADTPFGSVEERNLSKLYSVLSEDRDVVAKAFGFGDQIKAANALTAQRKMMENRVYGLLGKDFTGDLSNKATTALSGLSSGNNQAFRQLMRSIPDNATRKEVVATGMRDMLTKGSRSDLANNINGFVDYYGALKKNGNLKMLQSVLTKNTMRQLEDMYTLARNVKSANSYYLETGKLGQFLDKFEKPGGFLDKLATHGKMATIATILGHVPVAGPVLNTAAAAQMGAKAATKESGAAAVQNMMASGTWKKLAEAARKKPSPAQQEKIVKVAEKELGKSEVWKEFFRTLPKEDKEKIARIGIIAWLSGEDE